ncbi:hypothetical protein R6Q59_024723 [Mikania micrantha]
MSGYNRQGKFDSRTKHTKFAWIRKEKNDGSLDNVSCSPNDKTSIRESVAKDVASDVKNLKLTPISIEAGASCSPNDETSIRESVAKDVASDVKNLKLTPISIEAGASCSPNDETSIRESVVKDVASDVKNLKLIPISIEAGASCSPNDETSIRESVVKDVASDVKNLKLTPISTEAGASCSPNDETSIRESVVKDVASDVKNLKLTPISMEANANFKRVKQFGNKSQNDDDDDDGRLKNPVFDICPKRVSTVPKLNPPLHLLSKEKRNQKKQSLKGPNIIILRPGMILLKGYISSDDQISIVKTCRELGISNGGFYQPGYSGGTKLHLHMMCLGKNWDPESHTYTELRVLDNSKPPGIPEKFYDMVKKAIQDSNEYIQGNARSFDERKVFPSKTPDICIVNFYTKTGRLGLHQDKDESDTSLKKGLPVVSFSIGDSAEFLYGETRDVDEADKVILESGDVLIFGGKSRLLFHGVTSILPDSAPTSLVHATNMLPGRLNLTFRVY